MNTFPIVRRNEERKYDGEYRTERVSVETYDAAQESIFIGRAYQSWIDLRPPDPACCRPPR